MPQPPPPSSVDTAATLAGLAASQRALQASYASRLLEEQSLEAPLRTLAQRQPVAVNADAPVGQALRLMHERHVGSVLVLGGDGAAQGILTQHDVLDRVALAQLPAHTPIRDVMSQPVHTLTADHTAQDAALLMSRHGIRHLPVTEGGKVVGIVSQRDLFAMQRLSLKHVSLAIRAARDLEPLRAAAQSIRELARHLLGQGVAARQLTELISHLNDVLTEHLVGLVAAETGMDLGHACWLAFGSEGRSEQTIATDQDNGLVFASDDAASERAAWLAFARRINDALDFCGYPLCRGNVMASNPECCLTADEWRERFSHWMEHGAPQDLLAASIYFDLRPIAGRAELAAPLREFVTHHAQKLPRFMKQLAENALSHGPPLTWLGGIDGPGIDLKMQGTALFVDAARLLALAHGVPLTNTRRRFEALAAEGKVPAAEAEVWIGAFEFLQMLRLRVQIDAPARKAHAAQPNLLDTRELNELDRHVLKQVLRVARQLQQRVELDYRR